MARKSSRNIIPISAIDGIVIWQAMPHIPGNTWVSYVKGVGEFRVQRSVDDKQFFIGSLDGEPLMSSRSPAPIMSEMKMFALHSLKEATA